MKIKREINAVRKLDQQIHCVAIATVFQRWTYDRYEAVSNNKW